MLARHEAGSASKLTCNKTEKSPVAFDETIVRMVGSGESAIAIPAAVPNEAKTDAADILNYNVYAIKERSRHVTFHSVI